jgi:hypothetical protein
MILYQCRIHGMVDRIVQRNRSAVPLCYICHDTVILRFKWAPKKNPGSHRQNVSRTVGADQSRPVEVITYL